MMSESGVGGGGGGQDLLSRNLQQVATGLVDKASSADCVALLQSPARFTSCYTFNVLLVEIRGSCVALIFFFSENFWPLSIKQRD